MKVKPLLLAAILAVASCRGAAHRPSVGLMATPPPSGRVIGFDPSVVGLPGAIGDTVYDSAGIISWVKYDTANTAWRPVPVSQFVTGDPSQAPGLKAPIGFVVTMTDGSKSWAKSGSADTAWSVNPTPAIPDAGVAVTTDTTLSGNGTTGTPLHAITGLSSTVPMLSLGRSSERVISAGDSLVAGNNGATYSVTAGFKQILRSQLKRSGLSPYTEPIFTNSAVGGQTTHDLFVTNFTAQLGNPVSNDGDDFIIDVGINDIKGLAGNDGAGPFTQAQSIAIYQTGLTNLIAIRPNSRIFVLSTLFSAGETWKVVNGVAQGNNTADPLILSFNAALKAMVAQFPSVKYIDLYTPFYAAEAASNTANASSGWFTQDGTHTGVAGARLAGEVIAANVLIPKKQIPTSVLPVTPLDWSRGDWFEEFKSYIFSLRHTGVSVSPPLTLNYCRYIPLGESPIGVALPSGATAGVLEGGSVKFTTTSTLQVRTPVFQAPKTSAWAFGFRAAYPAQASGMVALFGLSDAAGTDSLLFGIDHTASATNFVMRETHGGVSSSFVGGAPMASDTAVHTWYVIAEGGLSGLCGGGCYDVTIDGTLISNLNPSANFPTTPQGVAAALMSSSPAGSVDVSDAAICFAR